jgi:predicted 3-demethylubiquinone-9 3-methyltransferase (glyoxalase superfamily)
MISSPIPCLWCDGTLQVQARTYAGLLPGATIAGKSPADWHPRPGAIFVMLDLGGSPLALLDGGPVHRPTPALSLALTQGDEGALRRIWAALAEGGQIMMPLQAWPWSALFGWVQDRWGVSWQLSLDPDAAASGPAVVPFLTFAGPREAPVAGRAGAALALYARVFPGAELAFRMDHDGSGPDAAGSVMLAQLTLAGGALRLSDSAAGHDWGFTPGTSLFVECQTQAQIDALWDGLIAEGGAANRCGWLTDPFGVSWQIVPAVLARIMATADPQVAGRVTQAFMGMTKLDIAAIEAAARG